MSVLPVPDCSALRIRAALPADGAAMLACFKLTMQPYIERAWGWDEAFQENGFTLNVRIDDCVVFESDADFAGFGAVQRQPDAWTLQMLCLMPAWQSRGMGTRWLRGLMGDATQAGLPLRLRVLKVNPARHLYERLGFQVEVEKEQLLEMVYRHDPAA